MKHNIIVRAARGTQGGYLHLDRIKIKGVEYCITKDLQLVRRDQLKASDSPLQLRITPDSSFSLNYEDSGGDNRNNERKKVAEALPYHHQMITEGFRNPNSGAALLFEFEDLAMNDMRNYQMEAMTLAAKNKAWNMSYREKLDAMYYYGENPTVQLEDGSVGVIDHRQVAIRLCGDNIGVIMRRIPYSTTGKTIIQHFVEDYKAADPNYVLKTTILKALILRDGEGRPLLKRAGNAIINGDDIIGSNLDEAVVWLNNNPERKKFLIKMVSQSDNIDADNLDAAIAQTEAGSHAEVEETLSNKATEQQIRNEAKEMMVKGWWNTNLKDLTAAMEEARPIWKEVDNLGLRVKISAMEKPNLEKVTKLVESEKKRLSAVAV